MHVAIIIDHERLEQEQSMLNRMCIGLMAEGVHITRIVPDQGLSESIRKSEKRIALAPRIETPMRVLPWMRSGRASRLAEQLERFPPDVVYAIGERSWPLGCDLGQALQKPVLLDVCSSDQARTIANKVGDAPIAGYIAYSGHLTRLLADQLDVDEVYLVPMGVSIPPLPRTIFGAPDVPPVLAIMGCSRDVAGYAALFEALRRLMKDNVEMHVFLELRGGSEHDIWRLAERLDLMTSISVVSDVAQYRMLFTDCDLLLLPEAVGEWRSIVLEAMALGIGIIAREDQAVDVLADRETAMIIKAADAEAWTTRLHEAFANHAQVRKLGMNARARIMTHHRSSDQVSRLIRALEHIHTGGNFRLPSAKA